MKKGGDWGPCKLKRNMPYSWSELVLRSTTAPPRRSRQFWNREILNQQPLIEQQKPHVYLAQMGVFRPCEESIFSFIFWHNLYLTALYLFFICWHSLLKFDCTISERELKYFNALSLKHSIKLSYFSESDQLYFYGNSRLSRSLSLALYPFTFLSVSFSLASNSLNFFLNVSSCSFLSLPLSLSLSIWFFLSHLQIFEASHSLSFAFQHPFLPLILPNSLCSYLIFFVTQHILL